MVDWGTAAGQVSAADVPLADAGAYFSTDNVEFALQQLAGDIVANGVEYTTSANVSKGDVLYISGNGTVAPYSAITTTYKAIGVALATVTSGNSVKCLANDTELSGLTIASAVAGAPVYWNGSGLTTVKVATSGAWLIQAGVCQDASGGMHIECKAVKKNA